MGGALIVAQLGGYELLSPLGAGGMGSVWRARDPHTGRAVALKRLHGAEAGAAAALRREVRALRRLDHPGVVTILGEGIADGLPWYAMELVRGRPLTDWALTSPVSSFQPSSAHTFGDFDLDGADPEPPQTDQPQWSAPTSDADLRALLTVLRRLCDVLAWLHGAGVVHRDLKPANVVVRLDGTPVLVDFGLTRRAEHEGREWLDLPDRAGTPAYMAPEQCRGAFTDARADLYALGCSIFELVAGRPPLLRSSVAATLRAQQHEAAPSLASVRPDVPAELDAIVARLLRKRAEDRVGYADTVGHALVAAGAPREPRFGPPPRAFLYRPAFSGRRAEVAALSQRVEAVTTGADGGLVLIGGESGAGKTRLATVAGRMAAARGARILLGRTAQRGVQEARAARMSVLRGPMEQLADLCRARGVLTLDAVFGPDAEVLSGLFPGLELGVEGRVVDPSEAVEATLGALGRAASGGLVVLLDDIQWADELALQLLRRVAEARPAELLVLATWRTEEGEAVADLERSAEGLRLGRLQAPDIGRLAASVLSLDPVPAALAEALAVESEGNPFVAAEVLRTAVAGALLTRDDEGRWRWSGGRDIAERVGALPLPSGIHRLVAHRAGLLDSASCAVLEAAAVWGREVPWDALEALAGHPAEEQVAELRARQFLEVGGSGLRFVHDKIREGVYRRTAPERRRALHAAAAERCSVDAVRATELASLARHLRGAASVAEAASAYARAGAAASAEGLPAEAERLYLAWSECVEELGTDDALTRLAFAAVLTEQRRRHAAAEAQLEKVRAFLGPEPSAELSCRLLDGSGTVSLGRGRFGEALLAFERAWPLVPAGDDALAAAVAAGMGTALQGMRRHSEAIEWRQRAADRARAIGNTTGTATQVQMIGQMQVLEGALDEGARAMKEALALQEAAGNTVGAVQSLNGLAWVEALYGRTSAAVEAAERARERSLRVGYRAGARHAALSLAYYLGVVGRWEEAEQLGSWVGEEYHRDEELELAHRARLNQAVALVGGGRLEAARTLLHELVVEGVYADPAWTGRARYWRARVGELDGDLAEAQVWLDQATSLLRDSPPWLAEAGLLQARLARLRGAPPAAVDARLAVVGDAGGDDHVALRILLERAAAARAAGRSMEPWLTEAQAKVAAHGMGPRSFEARDLAELTR